MINEVLWSPHDHLTKYIKFGTAIRKSSIYKCSARNHKCHKSSILKLSMQNNSSSSSSWNVSAGCSAKMHLIREQISKAFSIVEVMLSHFLPEIKLFMFWTKCPNLWLRSSISYFWEAKKKFSLLTPPVSSPIGKT
jgi:hypothetical protein